MLTGTAATLTLLTFAEVVATPGDSAITETFRADRPGDMWLTGRHHGAFVDSKWLALTPTTRIAVTNRSIREGSKVFGFLELADGRLLDLASVYAARTEG